MADGAEWVKSRGVEDIFIACVDGLADFGNAIKVAFPRTEVQRCIIHQIRNTTQHVSYKDIKALMADLNRVYTASDEPSALAALDEFSVFLTDDALMKMQYMAMMDITRNWTGRRVDWNAIYAQLEIFFAVRMPD